MQNLISLQTLQSMLVGQIQLSKSRINEKHP